LSSNNLSIALPHGVTSDGKRWLRSVSLRELNGYDEQHLSNLYKQQPGQDISAFDKVKELLTRVARFEDTTKEQSSSFAMMTGAKKNNPLFDYPELPLDSDLVARLTIGDKTALMLHFHRLMFGDTINAELSCPSCQKMISLEILVSDLLVSPKPDPQTEYQVEVDNFALKLRPVNGKDQQALLSLSEKSANKMSEYISCMIRACVISSNPPLPENISHKDELFRKISSKLGELDPQADILIDIKCPTCIHAFNTIFFIEDFVFQEIYARQQQLDNEIHLIAFYYHWNEDEILSLSTKRRKRHVELINETLNGGIENE
jgi:hypothetical protein